MKTLTLKINERTKSGKSFLHLMELFSKDKKSVEILSEQNGKPGKDDPADYPISKNVPNEETLRVFKENDKNKGNYKKFDSVEEFLKDLNS